MNNPNTEQILKLDHVSLICQGLTLLDDISFNVNKGDIVGIVGASGAGKTTLLRLLNRLINPTKGDIYFQGQNISTIAPIPLRQQIVLVLQESKLLGMTVQQALSYPLTLQKLPPTEIKTRLSTWIERLKIPSDWLELTELQLSVGQRQWVALARALIMQPTVLLLDEPTSALDVGKSEYLLQIFTKLSEENNTTILMVNHQLELVRKFAKKVIYLHQGQLKKEQFVRDMDWKNLKNDLILNQKEQFDEDF
jgi:D-methionine transport system ATP-binding protein